MINIKSLSIVFTLSIVLPSALFGQQKHGENDAWFLLLNKYELSDKISVGNETHLRFDDYFNDVQQFIIRPYLDLNFGNKDLVYSIGYSYIKTYPYGDFPLPAAKPENNVWEQITLNHKYGKLNVSHRYRLEQRFISNLVYNAQNDSFETEGNTYGNRFRYRITFKYDLSDKIFINAFDELWIKSSKGFFDADYDRNWIYAGIGYNISPDASIQLAYLHQNIKNNSTRYEIHPGFQLTGSINF